MITEEKFTFHEKILLNFKEMHINRRANGKADGAAGPICIIEKARA